MAATPTGRTYSDLLFMGGGQGASAHGDGKSGMLYPTSAANTSIEMFESRAPVLVLEKAYITDSGGAGEHRGGLGQRVRLRRLDRRRPDDARLGVSRGRRHQSGGAVRGKSGGGARGTVHDKSGALLRDCGTGELVHLSNPDDVIELCSPAAPGSAIPQKRKRAVRRDGSCRRLHLHGPRRSATTATAQLRKPPQNDNVTSSTREDHMLISRRAVIAGTSATAATLSLADITMAQGTRKVLIIAAGQDIPNFDPHVATGYSPAWFLRNVYDSLVRIENNPPQARPRPCEILDDVRRRDDIHVQARSRRQVPRWLAGRRRPR